MYWGPGGGRGGGPVQVPGDPPAKLQSPHLSVESAGRDSEEGIARMESNLGVAEQARQRLESRLLAKENEIGGLENKVLHTP